MGSPESRALLWQYRIASVSNDSVERNAIILPWNDIEVVEQILTDRVDDIAALICEPIPCVPQGGEPPEEGFLQAVRELTERLGILLIFDEVVTGLRMREGSAAAHFGIAPDLMTLGKVAGGGLPVGVFGGGPMSCAPSSVPMPTRIARCSSPGHSQAHRW